MRAAGVVGAILLCLTPGCASAAAQQWTPGPIITEYATPSLPGPNPVATPVKAAKPTVPNPVGAMDVSAFHGAHFASPTGRIWCAMDAESALCHFPAGMKLARVPKPAKVCPGEDLDVTGVSVAAEAGYFCSGGVEAVPQTDSEYVAWWKPTGFPAVTYQGQSLATLPYGSKLIHGSFVCLSEEAGVTCGNAETGAGFTVSRAGVTFIG
jgi:hypothetical protein